MERIFLRRRGNRRWRFCPADFTETTEAVCNPARGWYQIFTFYAEKEPDFKELEWCIDKRDALALVMINIGAFRDRSLKAEGLARIGRILSFFRKNRCDVILRIAYDHEGKAMEREPFFFERVLQHIKELGEVLQEYGDIIFVFQGVLVGNWGEMHTSRFLGEDKLRSMAGALASVKGRNTYLAVRRPVHWRMLHPEGLERGIGEAAARDQMGLFDDGIFGSESNLGTFGENTGKKPGWQEPWGKKEELLFEGKLCRTVPNGGEAVFGDPFYRQLTPQKVLAELAQMRITYLNRTYDQRLLTLFGQWECSAGGVWQGKSVFDYIGGHMGYRFVIRKVKAVFKKEGPGLEITVQNKGFAPLYQEAELFVFTEDKMGPGQKKKLSWDMRSLDPGEEKTFFCDIWPVEGPFFLEMKRKRDGAVIRFANSCDKRGRIRLGTLEVDS